MRLMMIRKRFAFLVWVLGLWALAGCMAAPPQAGLGADGARAPVIYRIDPADTVEIQFRMLDSVNALRRTAAAPPLRLSPALNAAAATHAGDMALQNRPWHFGSDGSSPIDRARVAGYRGAVLGEAISETYESELETIAAWMARADTRSVLIDPAAREMGVAFFQEPSGKIWWALVTGDGAMPGPTT
jgi:uncharacterized protein YkwD